MRNKYKIPTKRINTFYPAINKRVKDFVTKKEFDDIIEAFSKILVESMLETGYIFKFPIGYLGVLKKKDKAKTYPDWAHFYKTGEYRRLRNKHSNDYYAGIYWLRQIKFHINRPSTAMKWASAPYAKKRTHEVLMTTNNMETYTNINDLIT